MAGWVKLHRKMLEWEWYDDHNTFRLFMTLLMMANHADKKWRGNLIMRGSLLTSLDSLSVTTGLSVQQIRTSLGKLIATGEITNKSTSKNRIITISKWDSYQNDNNQDNREVTNEQQAGNKQVTTNKNVKNVKNDKEVLAATPFTPKKIGLNFDLWSSKPSDQVLRDYKKNRKAALTQTAVDRMASEINKASDNGMTADECLSVCCEAGWQGFKYDWYLNREKQNGQSTRGSQNLSGSAKRAADFHENLKLYSEGGAAAVMGRKDFR